MRKTSLLILVIALLFLVACGAPSTAPTAPPETAPMVAPEKVTNEPSSAIVGFLPGGLRDYEKALEDIYAQLSPSVVNIRSTIDTGPLLDFQQEGTGSGFVWDTAGHIVTNAHVVANARDVMVTFHDDDKRSTFSRNLFFAFSLSIMRGGVLSGK